MYINKYRHEPHDWVIHISAYHERVMGAIVSRSVRLDRDFQLAE